MAVMRQCRHHRVWDHYLFFCFWLSFFFFRLFCLGFFFFTITNTKDPVEKTFCFTGNKKIIYASVKCKKLTSPLHPAKPGLSGVYRNQLKHTGDSCIFLHHCGERIERTAPTDRTQLLCTTFQVMMNKRWNWQPCLSLLFCPPPTFICPRGDWLLLLLLLIRWCCSCWSVFVVLDAFLFVPLFSPFTLKPPAEKHGFKPLFF